MAVTDVTVDQSARAVAATTTYRAGIIGAGFMGGVHARAIRVNGGEVVGVVASDPERSAEASEALLATRTIANVDELLSADDVDVVHVCTPNYLHHPLVMRAIEAGKHIVCEKPLATNPGDAHDMWQAIEQTGAVGTVPFVYRFHPMVREARDRVRRGELGRLLLAHGAYLQDWLCAATDDNWRVDARQGGQTRAFGDIGSHWCDLLEFVSGDTITSLSARSSTVNATRGVDSRHAVDTEDLVVMQFETRGGVLGTATISQVSPGRKNRLLLEVSGTESTLAFDQEESEKLWVGRREGSQLLVRDPETLSPAAARYTTVPAGHPQGYQECFAGFVADTASAIAGEAPDGLPTFADGLRAARLADAVVRSAASQTWVEVDR
ncbi:gfo/Idh/MocA family oxidoreductase [Pseudactinotalea sp. HY160]|uniref:Gfo/Idh/MocA family protein n=1 Tax=Pseudactinotalea sp. HY160 TaxID=2654490 RepID=UPI00128B175B|nr:Gfo/Idh/MocA family oxidoreductase [Pseudactinotalea sp. HY160]MPV50875.1 gfo/Idh/MocA family oxidoreductase [Pseudactinotalea sp. HY160]